MNKLPSNELNILSFSNTCSSQEAKIRFQEIFGVKPDYFNENKLYLNKGEGVHHLKKGHLHFLLHGDFYNNLDDIKFFQIPFDEKDVELDLQGLNGSFVILAFNDLSRSFQIITDRLNSKKIFLYENNSFTVLSTNPVYFRNIDQKINIAGIASYLVNGVIYNNNTLFEKIKALERASLHTFSGNIHKSLPYWKYEFTNEFADVPKIELRKRFANLLMNSVRKRIQAVKPEICFLALSGGYDSRFLLGALRSIKNEFQLKTFSYGMYKNLPLGDDLIACRLADKFNFDHHVEPAYLNNFISTINRNVEFGYGFSNFCAEINAILRLSDKFSESHSSLLFTGDMYYLPSLNFDTIRDKRLLLLYSLVFPSYFIRLFLTDLPLKNQTQLILEYDEMYQNILKRLPDTNDFMVLKDFAYIDQRVSHTLMYWRNCFYAPFIKVAQPLLDNDLLDFIRKLPNGLRYNKILYKETLNEMFPELFNVPIAKNAWAYPSWNDEIKKNKNEIINDLFHLESKLDSIIPPNTIVSLINNEKDASIKYKLSKCIGVIARKCSCNVDTLNNLFGSIILKNYHIMRYQLIIRLLLLREATKF